jgi:polar amino acid transport system substrate-binding protein
MKRKSVFLGAAFCLLSACGSPLWAGETGLTTLDWRPYTCATASGGGVTTQTLRRLLGDEGDTLKVEFLPWRRAVATAEEGGGAS